MDKRHDILDVLESTLLDQLDNFSISNLSSLFYFYAKNRIGSRVLIESLKHRISKESTGKDSKVDRESLVLIVASLDMVGADEN